MANEPTEQDNHWYLNEKETNGAYCVYQREGDGISHKLGPFFVLGRAKAWELFMVLNAMAVVNGARLEAVAKLQQYEANPAS